MGEGQPATGGVPIWRSAPSGWPSAHKGVGNGNWYYANLKLLYALIFLGVPPRCARGRAAAGFAGLRLACGETAPSGRPPHPSRMGRPPEAGGPPKIHLVT